MNPSRFVLVLALASLGTAGCIAQPSPRPIASAMTPPAAPPPPPPTTTTAPSAPARAAHVYRFDMVLTPRDPTNPSATASTFALTVEEGRHGELMIGKNVVLTPPPAAPARSDVGLKINLDYKTTANDDILMDVRTEMSGFEPPTTIRKVTSFGNVLASPGKAALVVSLDDDKKHYELTVTATKLR